MPKKLNAFPYYGGKFYLLNWILPRLPECRHYVEPFGGGANILLNRDPSHVETYNDLDIDVVNFFRVLRTDPNNLIQQIIMTPHSRLEFARALSPERSDSMLERARKFYVRAKQSRYGSKRMMHASSWGVVSKTGTSKANKDIEGKMARLANIARRMLKVQIEDIDALKLIKRCDTPDTLFYCDPPYAHEARACPNEYIHEMSDEQHIELSELLQSVKGKVALSGYDCELYEKLYTEPKWQKHTYEIRLWASSDAGKKRTECLWTNYKVERGALSPDSNVKKNEDR